MRIAVIGRSEILYESIALLIESGFTISCILTAKEAPEYTRKAEDFHTLAKKLNIPYGSSGKIKDYTSFFKSSNSDLAISMNYTNIIPQSIIDIFPLGILNAHGGDLPRYRGNACQSWALLNGEKKIGLCIHKMIGNELDSGPIISRAYIAINQNTTITHVWEWMSNQIPILFLESAKKLSDVPSFILEEQSKNPEDILRCYPRKPEDAKINWDNNANYLLRLINASCRPYSGAYCFLENEKITITKASVVESTENFCAVAGQVLRFNDKFADVACREGILRIEAMEVHDKPILPTLVIKSIRQRFS